MVLHSGTGNSGSFLISLQTEREILFCLSLSCFNMYRIIATILFSLALTQAVFAQTDSASAKKYRHGISVGTFVSGVPGFPYYLISYSISKGRNRVSIGPVFRQKGGGSTNWTARNVALQNDNYLKGLSGVYQFFPNPRGKRYDLFFQYEATWLYFNYDALIENSGIWTRTPNYASCWYLGQYVGYGLRVRFLKNFEITHNVGLGYLAGKYKNSYGTFSVGEEGISGNTRISLSYTFR